MRRLEKSEIQGAFSSRERKKLKISIDPDKVDWENIDFLGWVHPSGHLGYIVYEQDESLIGLVLERNKPGGITKGAMCNLCMTVHGSRGVVLFTVKVANQDASYGTYICADLQCSLYVRGLKPLSPNQMRETISIEAKVARLKRNLEKFIGRS